MFKTKKTLGVYSFFFPNNFHKTSWSIVANKNNRAVYIYIVFVALLNIEINLFLAK